MKALVLREVEKPLQIEERPTPKPGAGEVVVELRAAALNRRDYWITQGLYPGIRLPVILGSDGAGVVARTGADVDTAWQGREVVINPGLEWGSDAAAQGDDFRILGMPDDGTFATEVVIPATQLFAKPSHLDWREAAALPLAGVTAYRALFAQGRLQSDERVLVTGIGGGVATLVLEFAEATGARVFVTSSSDDKIAKAVDRGAVAGVNYKADGWAEKLQSEHGPMHLIVDSAGGEGYRALIDLAASGGRIVSYGATKGPPKRFDLFKIFWKQLHLVGSTMGSPEDFRAMLRLVEEKKIQPIVDETFPLEKGQQALDEMKTSPQFGKLVLEMS